VYRLALGRYARARVPEDVGVVNPQPSSAGERALRTEFGGGGEDGTRKKVSVSKFRREGRVAWPAPREDSQFPRDEGGRRRQSASCGLGHSWSFSFGRPVADSE